MEKPSICFRHGSGWNEKIRANEKTAWEEECVFADIDANPFCRLIKPKHAIERPQTASMVDGGLHATL